MVIIRPDRPAKQESKEGDVKRVGDGSGFRADGRSNRYVERNLR